MQPVYLVVGVSGSGKSWVCRQVSDKFFYVPHDICWYHPTAKPKQSHDAKWGPKGSKSIHFETLIETARESKKPLITECPFGERMLRENLEQKGIKVIPVFVVEPPTTVADRYQSREGKPLPLAAYSRATTIVDRAREWHAFHGTSEEVLQHLRKV